MFQPPEEYPCLAQPRTPHILGICIVGRKIARIGQTPRGVCCGWSRRAVTNRAVIDAVHYNLQYGVLPYECRSTSMQIEPVTTSTGSDFARNLLICDTFGGK